MLSHLLLIFFIDIVTGNTEGPCNVKQSGGDNLVKGVQCYELF